jgi:hypothetical protein
MLSPIAQTICSSMHTEQPNRLTRLVADASLPAPIIPDRLFAAIAQPRWCSLSAALHYMGTR